MLPPSPHDTKSLHTYEMIGHRVQRILTDPQAQKTQSVTVARRPGERPEDWRRLMTEIADTAGIRLDDMADGAVRISWREYCEA